MSTTGEVYNGTDIDHIRLREKPSFIEAAVFLVVYIKLRSDADLIDLYIEYHRICTNYLVLCIF